MADSNTETHNENTETHNESVLERRLSKIYAEGRAFVQHEDDLVDRRLKWVITISGFLFAAYGGSLIASANGAIKPEQQALTSLARMGFGFIGVVSSLVGALSIHAAHMAIKAITRKYNTFLLANKSGIESGALHAWQLIGDRATNMPGFYSSLVQPYLIAAIWFVLIMIEAYLFARVPELKTIFAIQELNAEIVGFLGLLLTVVFLCCIGAWLIDAEKKLARAGTSGERSKTIAQIRTEVSNIKNLSDDSFKNELPYCKNCQN